MVSIGTGLVHAQAQGCPGIHTDLAGRRPPHLLQESRRMQSTAASAQHGASSLWPQGGGRASHLRGALCQLQWTSIVSSIRDSKICSIAHCAQQSERAPLKARLVSTIQSHSTPSSGDCPTRRCMPLEGCKRCGIHSQTLQRLLSRARPSGPWLAWWPPGPLRKFSPEIRLQPSAFRAMCASSLCGIRYSPCTRSPHTHHSRPVQWGPLAAQLWRWLSSTSLLFFFPLQRLVCLDAWPQPKGPRALNERIPSEIDMFQLQCCRNKGFHSRPARMMIGMI